ncbi:hypothetical protein V7S43_013751 [Phytophthora oleae]|uniref:RxLR effector protein n=1 Tax=Phytophthora oleae TaxID=2107226 RepID=A0ABD3F2V6_9STRA
MRLRLLLVIATAIFACCDAAASGSSPTKLSISNSADSLQTGGAGEIVGKRILRGSNAKNNGHFTDEDVEEEERALPNLSKLDDEANVKFLIGMFQNWDDIGVRGIIAFIKKEAISLDELLPMFTFYQQYRQLGPDEFAKLMTKVTAP